MINRLLDLITYVFSAIDFSFVAEAKSKVTESSFEELLKANEELRKANGELLKANLSLTKKNYELKESKDRLILEVERLKDTTMRKPTLVNIIFGTFLGIIIIPIIIGGIVEGSASILSYIKKK